MTIFEITIQHKRDDIYPVVAEYIRPENLPIRTEGHFPLNASDLEELKRLELNPLQYGIKLGKALFKEEVLVAFMQARLNSQSDQSKQNGLHLLLVVETPELKPLLWGRLCAPTHLGRSWDFLALNQNVLFSMYLPSLTDRHFPAIKRPDLKALIMVADPPEGNRFEIDPFNVKDTVAGIRESIGEIPHDILANTQGSMGPPTLDRLCECISGRHYTLLHIVAHGRFNSGTEETILYLLDSDGQVKPVDATQLLKRLDRLEGERGLPHFVFLCTCESAKPGAETSDALGGLGQRLVRDLGIPAVVAMTEKITISTANAFSRNFYIRLRKHGEPDRAMGQACAGLADEQDITVPVLLSRLGGRPLFSDDKEGDLTDNEIEFGLSRLESLLPDRAPILMPSFTKESEVLRGYFETDRNSLDETARLEYDKLLNAMNALSEEILNMNFRALAFGKEPLDYVKCCPFPGLQAFNAKNKNFFFGREVLVKKLADRLEQENFLAILGPSGCGKSSLVFAGIVPELETRDSGIQTFVMSPGKNPGDRLNSILAKIDTDRKTVLVVDQFEELFTLCMDTKVRENFLDMLTKAPQNENGMKIIITMRGDFMNDCAKNSALGQLIQKSLKPIMPMNTAELRNAMEQQAAAVNLRFEADLSHTILTEVQDEPGAMPLLEHLLQEMWNRRHGRWLRASEYRALGGIRKAIAHTADGLYHELDDTGKNQMRNIFLRLIRLGEDTGSDQEYRDTRQRVLLKDLVPVDGDKEDVRKIVHQLADAKLLMTDDKEVEVSHESLIRHWPRLRRWLNEDRSGLRIWADINEEAKKWDRGGRLDNELPQWNNRLEKAGALFLQTRFAPNQLQQEYFNECIALRDREIEREKQYTASLKSRLFVAIIAIFIAVISGGFAAWKWDEAAEQTHIANNKLIEAKNNLGFALYEKAEREFKNKNINAAKLYSLHALVNFNQEPTGDGIVKTITNVINFNRKQTNASIDINRIENQRAKALGLIIGNIGYSKVFTLPSSGSYHNSKVNCILFKADGKSLFSVEGNTIHLWDMETGKEKFISSEHTDSIKGLTLSKDGNTLVSWEGGRANTIRLWDTEMLKEKQVLFGHWREVLSAVLLSDCKTILSVAKDNTIRFWDLNREEESKIIKQKSDSKAVCCATLSPEGKYLALGFLNDNNIQLLDIEKRKEKAIITDHKASVREMVFSKDGKTLSSRDIYNSIYIWDVETCKRKLILEGQRSVIKRRVINCMSFSPDGKILASGLEDGTIIVWDAKNGIKKDVLKLHSSAIHSLSFSPDGTILASGSNEIRLWNIEIGKEKMKQNMCQSRINSLTFSSDGRTLVSGSNDSAIRFWDLKMGREISYLHTKGYNGVVYSPNGKVIASHSYKTIFLLEVDTENEKQIIVPKGIILNLAFSPDGKILASGIKQNSDFESNLIKLWNVKTTNEIACFKGRSINSICFSSDGKTLAAGSEGEIVLWDVKTKKIKTTMNGGIFNSKSLIFSTNGTMLASMYPDAIFIWDVKTGEKKTVFDGHGLISCFSFSPDGKIIASGSKKNSILLWDVDTGKVKAKLTVHTSDVDCIGFSPDGRVLAYSTNNTIQLWDVENKNNKVLNDLHAFNVLCFSPGNKSLAMVENYNKIYLRDLKTGKETKTISGPANSIFNAAFSPNGKTIATVSNIIRLWDIETGKEINYVKGYADKIISLSFLSDGKILASGSRDGTIRLWNIENEKEIKVLYGHTDVITSLCSSSVDKIFASGSRDGTIRLWNIENGKEIKVLYGHTDVVTSVCSSPVDKIFASGSRDGTIRLWNIENGKEIKVFYVHSNCVTSICFSPDGKTLASVSEDDTIHTSDNSICLWNIESGKEKAFLSVDYEVKILKFSPNGNSIVSCSYDARIHQYDISLFDRIRNHRLKEDEVKETEQMYNLQLVDLELHSIPSERNLYGIKPQPPKWSKSHPFHWLSKAETGHTEAMIELGVIYDRNNELDKAYHWYTKAIEAGSERGKVRMKVFKQWLKLQKADQDNELDKAWRRYTKIIEAGNEEDKRRMKVFRHWLSLNKDEFSGAYEKFVREPLSDLAQK